MRIKAVWQNNYARLAIIFALLYIFTHAFSFPLSDCDYIIAVYICTLHKIHENALQYGILFGLAYDLNYQIYLGAGVILFMLLNFIKVQVFQMIDMSKIYSRFIFKSIYLIVYTFLTLRFFGWPSVSMAQSLVYFTLTSTAAVLVISLFTGGARAFRRA